MPTEDNGQCPFQTPEGRCLLVAGHTGGHNPKALRPNWDAITSGREEQQDAS